MYEREQLPPGAHNSGTLFDFLARHEVETRKEAGLARSNRNDEYLISETQ